MTKVSNTQASRHRSKTSRHGVPVTNTDRQPEDFRICETCPEPSCAGCPVKADPARQARIEREDRNKLRWLTILAFVVAAVVGLFAVGEWQIHSIVSSHNSELAQIDAIVKHVNNSQANHYQTVKDIEAIVKADTADKNLVILGTGEGLADYQAICNAIPGCKLPYPSP